MEEHFFLYSFIFNGGAILGALILSKVVVKVFILKGYNLRMLRRVSRILAIAFLAVMVLGFFLLDDKLYSASNEIFDRNYIISHSIGTFILFTFLLLDGLSYRHLKKCKE